MISEPEMVGEFGAMEVREVVGDLDREPLYRHRPGRPWLWALSGVVTASALWAAAVFVYGLGEQTPDARGYRLAQDLCPSVQLASIGAAISPRDSAGMNDSGLVRHPALDQVQCFIPLRSRPGTERSGNGSFLDYTVGITVALHKETDPGAEFEARLRVSDLGVVPEENVEALPRLGDKAYLITRDLGNVELRVLDGGVVLSLSLSAYRYYDSEDSAAEAGDGQDVPDVTPYEQAMIKDMRALMADLRQ
ncbi:hypothetical protein ACFV0T_26850 [Streptomyces sp. NPDC059582]|uniref:hypothetical protein n=1 Tax=Streptomyces sp. NPDC059582 TaxID=3346875 RepID=UPI0036956F70